MNYYELVKEFEETADGPEKKPMIEGTPQEILNLIISLIQEEVVHELLPALEAMKTGTQTIEKLTPVLDGMVDSIYVILFGAIKMRLPIQEAFVAVQESNMKKFFPCSYCKGEGCLSQKTTVEMIDGQPISITCNTRGFEVRRNQAKKIQKPFGWKAPDIFSVLVAKKWQEIAATRGKLTSTEEARKEGISYG